MFRLQTRNAGKNKMFFFVFTGACLTQSVINWLLYNASDVLDKFYAWKIKTGEI